jgi:hypothetical protein
MHRAIGLKRSSSEPPLQQELGKIRMTRDHWGGAALRPRFVIRTNAENNVDAQAVRGNVMLG